MYGHGVVTPSYRKRTAYQAMLLGGIATLASTMLVLGDMETRADIALRKAEDLKASLSQVVPDESHDNDLLSDVLTLPAQSEKEEPFKVYRAHQNGRISAVAFKVTAIGYAGPVTSMMGVDADGKVLGVRVISHAETPGLGDKIEISRDDWILSFNQRSLANTSASQWQVKKDGGDFDQFTGATITPRAVVKSVYEGLQAFAAHRNELLKPPAVPEQTTDITPSIEEKHDE